MLGALGATDWVDGYLARRLNQVSEFGKVFDPIADRILFIVAIVAIMIDGSMPIWFGVAVLAREVLVGSDDGDRDAWCSRWNASTSPGSASAPRSC